jgi:hypothetical protein
MPICIKLYKRSRSKLLNVSVYNPKPNLLIVDEGEVGRQCKQTVQTLGKNAATDALVRRRARDFTAKGYKIVPESKLKTVLVQMQLKGWGSSRDLDRRYKLMDLLDAHLGVTLSGHVDGGDIGSGTANIWCLSVDPGTSARTIANFLKRKRLIKNIVIAIDRGKEFDVTYPRNFKGKVLL